MKKGRGHYANSSHFSYNSSSFKVISAFSLDKATHFATSTATSGLDISSSISLSLNSSFQFLLLFSLNHFRVFVFEPVLLFAVSSLIY